MKLKFVLNRKILKQGVYHSILLIFYHYQFTLKLGLQLQYIYFNTGNRLFSERPNLHKMPQNMKYVYLCIGSLYNQIRGLM